MTVSDNTIQAEGFSVSKEMAKNVLKKNLEELWKLEQNMVLHLHLVALK